MTVNPDQPITEPRTYVLTAKTDGAVMAWTRDYDFGSACAEMFGLDMEVADES